MNTTSTSITVIKPAIRPIHLGLETPRIMTHVIVALCPAAACGCFLFGTRAALTLGMCMLSCMAFEFVISGLHQRTWTLSDGSSIVTGILLALALPSTTPIAVCVAASFIAIVIAKHVFGGLGANVFNPALVARALCTVAFPAAVSNYQPPVRYFFNVDAVSAATPLALLKFQNVAAIAKTLGDPLHRYAHLLAGNHSGSLGETSVLALLAGGLYLISKRVISWHIPVAMYGAAALVAVIAWPHAGDPLVHLLSGGLALGAFFMATDYVTAPVYPAGKLIFGAGCGCLLMIIRLWGVYPEGCMYAILAMNVLVPVIDKATTPQPFGQIHNKTSIMSRCAENASEIWRALLTGFTHWRNPSEVIGNVEGNSDCEQNKAFRLEPIAIIGLAVGPLLAVATSLRAAIPVAICLILVQVLTGSIFLLVQRRLTRQMTLLLLVAVAAGWAAAIRMVCHAFLPSVAALDTLSWWLLPSSLIILNMPGQFSIKPSVNRAWHGNVATSLAGMAIGIGLGYVLILIACIREFLGTGTLFMSYSGAKPILPWALTGPGGCAVAALVIFAVAPHFSRSWLRSKEPGNAVL
jgi:Na+-translocating ferredoxin:NAD+ oxidoreductase subunit D